MASKLTRALTLFVAAASVTLAGAGIAAADGPGGKGSSTTTSAAAEVQSMRDALVSRADNGDVAGTQATLDRLAPVLTDLSQGKRYVIQAEAKDSAATARQDNTTAKQDVDELATELKSRAQLPPVAGLLNALLQRLLLSLSVLVNDLLGGLAVPVV